MHYSMSMCHIFPLGSEIWRPDRYFSYLLLIVQRTDETRWTLAINKMVQQRTRLGLPTPWASPCVLNVFSSAWFSLPISSLSPKGCSSTWAYGRSVWPLCSDPNRTDPASLRPEEVWLWRTKKDKVQKKAHGYTRIIIFSLTWTDRRCPWPFFTHALQPQLVPTNL